MWVHPDDDPRESLDEGTGERAVLSAYLDRYRMTFEMKCDGLDEEQLARRSVPTLDDVVARARATSCRR
jgi:hypothetical protein